MLDTNKKRILSAGVIIFALVLIWMLMLYSPRGGDGSVIITVEKGDGLLEVADKLKQVSAISSKYVFVIHVTLIGKQDNLMAGIYEIAPTVSTAGVASMIISGKIATDNLTIFEGWTLRDIASWFENQGKFQTEEIFEITGFPATDVAIYDNRLSLPMDFSEQFQFLVEKPKGISLEGYLFPDTYFFLTTDNEEDVLKSMSSNFQKKIFSDRKSTRLNSSHIPLSRMPSSA